MYKNTKEGNKMNKKFIIIFLALIIMFIFSYSDAQNSTNADVTQSSAKTDQEIFEESLRLLMPLSKKQITDFRAHSNDRERALSPAPPRLETRTVRVKLEPGAAPTKVRTTANIATSLVFHDSTGEPWPITSITNGSPNSFQVLKPEIPDENLVNIVPQEDFSSSSLVITLKGQDLPLIVALDADSIKAPTRTADALVLFQLAGHGPKAKIPVIKNMKDTVSSDMISIIDHISPKDSVKIHTTPEDPNVEVWRLGDTHYIRTSYDLMWPAWTAAANGAGNVKCYEIPQTHKILVSLNGIVSTFTILEYE